MRSHRRTTGRLATALCAAFMLVVPSSASAATIANGGFEAGAFTGWTKSTQGSGDWYVYSGTTAPSGQSVAAPPQGTNAATTDQSGPGSHVLYQDVALEASARHTLTFKLYYRSSASLVSPNTLEHTGSANQQYRVDVIGPAAPIRSVSAADVLATAFKTTPGDPTTLAPTTITLDLTPFAGQTVRLRFAEVDNQSNFTASVDDVAIDTVLIDSAAPETTITAGPADGETTSTTTPAFEFASGESGSSFACSVDGGAASACTSPFTATTLDDGTHTFSVAATDGAGNTDTTPATRSFTVSTPPVDVAAETPAPGAAPPANCVSRRKFTIRLRPANVPLVSAVVKVRGKRVTARRSKGRMTAAIDLRGLARGTYAVTVDARDARQRHFKETRRFRTC